MVLIIYLKLTCPQCAYGQLRSTVFLINYGLLLQFRSSSCFFLNSGNLLRLRYIFFQLRSSFFNSGLLLRLRSSSSTIRYFSSTSVFFFNSGVLLQFLSSSSFPVLFISSRPLLKLLSSSFTPFFFLNSGHLLQLR
jgi:hypothetical protein